MWKRVLETDEGTFQIINVTPEKKGTDSSSPYRSIDGKSGMVFTEVKNANQPHQKEDDPVNSGVWVHVGDKDDSTPKKPSGKSVPIHDANKVTKNSGNSVVTGEKAKKDIE